MQVPLVYSFHTLFSRYIHHAPFIPKNISKGILNTYLAFFCNQVDRVIVPSEMVRRLLLVQGVKKAIQVIPNGVALRNIKPKLENRRDLKLETRKKYGIPPEAKLLLSSGRISEEKNIPFLLKAFPFIRKQEENVYLLMAGGGPKEKDYRKMAAALDPNIIFIGQVPHSEHLNCCLAADIFVYASVTETQGLVMTEAKACGLPVVALFSGALCDIIKNGTDGYLVPRNEEAFCEHVLRLVRDESLRKGMSLKALEDAAARFCSSRVAKQIETVYNSLINPLTKLGIK
jgi:glycosyltransferase involved in cell wall biosynthesis